MARSRSKKPSLQSGRPPTATRRHKAINSKATQKTIVSFHQLNKALAEAKSKNDVHAITQIEARIGALGGLKAYQAASIQGQSSSRGGDSSLVLMHWLSPIREHMLSRPAVSRMRLLEVGALSTKNECSRSKCFDTTRIDLHSQEPGILKQDFMHRPLPRPDSAADRFDIISLSLVLNFVPSSHERGEMLRRTTLFLRPKHSSSPSASPPSLANSALLFLVLPAPCVLNSRYFDDERLGQIMTSLGYVMVKRKQSQKLVYWLWQLSCSAAPHSEQSFGKSKVRDGPSMNNFYVELRPLSAS